MITGQMDCFNAIRNVLTGNDNGDVVDNYKNQAKRLDAEAQVVNYNVQQTSNAEMKDPYQVM
jgi:hypothetical protein